MAKEADRLKGMPKTIEFKNKLITCPVCGAKIQVDLDLDISCISGLARSLRKMRVPQKDGNK